MEVAEHAVEQAYDDEDLLPISALQHLLFCERRAALIYIEGVWEENEYTAKGTEEHIRVHQAGTEAQGDVIVVRGLRLCSYRLGLTGQADVVEFHRCLPECSVPTVSLPGRSGLWQLIPVEYKSGSKRREEGYEVQLCAQALCLEEMLTTRIDRGALYYAGSARRLEVLFTPDLRRATEIAAASLHKLLCTKYTPRPMFGRKCGLCSLSAQCLPESMGRRSATKYLLAATSGDEEPLI